MKRVIRLEKPFEPLLCKQAIGFFKGILRPDSRVFEWGAGGSTLWLAERVTEGRLVSVEHVPGWYKEVGRALREYKLQADLRLEDEARYALAISEFPDCFFDIVFIDGLDRTRNDCIVMARPKVRPGGWMVIHDTNWAKLRPGVRLLAGWECKNFTGEKAGRANGKMTRSTTSFYRKPK